MRPGESCRLFGAYRACAGIKDAVVLIHSVVGCNVGTLSLHMAQHPMDVRQAATVIYEQDVLYGGTDTLRKALLDAAEVYPDPQVIIVISGCVPNIIGDDMEAAITDAGLDIPVLHIMGAGMQGRMTDGYESALLALGEWMHAEPVQERTCNILGMSVDDPRAEGDIAALRDIFGGRLHIRTVLGCGTFSDMRNAPRAALNIVLGGQGRLLAQFMKDRFGTPYLMIDYPYGVYGLTRFLTAVSNALGVGDTASWIESIETRAEPLIRQTKTQLRNLYGTPVAVIGDAAHAPGFRAFLEEELGMEVVVYSECEGDMQEAYDAVRASSAVMVFGSSYEKQLCEDGGRILIRAFYPVFDEIQLTPRGFLGITGLAHILEEIINAVLQHDAHRRRLYGEVRLTGREHG